MRELNQVEHYPGGAGGRGHQGQVLLVGCEQIPDLIERPHAGAGQLGDAGQVGEQRDRAAAAGRKQPPDQHVGRGDVDRAAYQGQAALAVEREDLGIAGGRQDQLAQAHGGLTLMDFSSDPDGHVERLDPSLLPPLVVAWRSQVAEHSGVPHAELRSRYGVGDMAELAALAHAAAAALQDGDHAAFGHAVDESFEHRARMVSLHPGHVEMIHAARAAGAAANYSGSGGAIVAVCTDAEHREQVTGELRRLGCGVLSAPA